jgi:hypothetical protein
MAIASSSWPPFRSGNGLGDASAGMMPALAGVSAWDGNMTSLVVER